MGWQRLLFIVCSVFSICGPYTIPFCSWCKRCGRNPALSAAPYTASCISFGSSRLILRFGIRRFSVIWTYSIEICIKLDEVQDSISTSGYNEDLFNEEVTIQAELNDILPKKDLMARQKSRNTWLKDGDRNTAFFHRMANFKRSQHLIPSLMIEDELISDPMIMGEHVVDFYSTLFGANEQAERDLSYVDNIISHSVMWQQAQNITTIPDGTEIRAAVFSMEGSSSSGPDGFGGIFYHTCWPIVSEDITRVVQTFFMKNYLPKGLNSNTVILLPKKEAAVTITDF